MSTMSDDFGQRLADRLRVERDSRDWSLSELAERSGVAKATISKIERAEASPTAVILVKLAKAFGMTLAALMARAEERHDLLIRSSEQPVWRDPETGYVRKQVFRHPDHPVELVKVEMPARQSVTLSAYVNMRQAVWVLRGNLVLVEDGERHQLGPGDCLGFGTPADVTFANETAIPCEYIVALARS
ncbi:MAG: XRE family transcriptional regulator [Tardiphaga sp.]